jgi:hypothetical protein
VIIVYSAVNLRVDISLLYVMRRDQEGRQRQGMRTVFKPLKERYGKTDESRWTTLRRLPYDWSNDEEEDFHPMK